MRLSNVQALGVGLAMVMQLSSARAETGDEWRCSVDAECGGGLVCKAGNCEEPPTQRRSEAMMGFGGIMVAAGAILALAGGYQTQADSDETRPIVMLLSGAALVAGGLPLIVIGGKRVPVDPKPTAVIAPYLTLHAAGLGLLITL